MNLLILSRSDCCNYHHQSPRRGRVRVTGSPHSGGHTLTPGDLDTSWSGVQHQS